MLVAFSAFTFLGALAAEQDEQTLKYDVHFDSEPKSDILEKQTITLTYPDSDRVETVELAAEIESIDEVYYTGNRCLVIGTLISHAGQTVDVVDATSAKVVASERCFWPVVSPDHNRVVFENWYPRFLDPRTHWPVVLAMDVARAEDGPVQVYPVGEPNPWSADADKHLALTPKVWNEDSDAVAFLDKFGDYTTWKAPYKIYCVLVRFDEEGPLPPQRALVDVDSFVRPEASYDFIGFRAESLDILDDAIRGTLRQKGYLRSPSEFSFDMKLIEKGETLTFENSRVAEEN
jgi:hypothetical protein